MAYLTDTFTSQLTVQTFIIFMTVGLVSWVVFRIIFPNRGTLPPGPLTLPIIGNLLQIAASGKDQYIALLELSKKYGPMFTIQIANFQVVVLTGYKLVREGLVEKGYALRGRPNDLYLPRRFFQKRGILWGTGERWHGLRKFTSIILRDLGVGRKTLEQRIQDEAVVIMREIEETTAPFESKRMFIKAAANIICSIVRGARYEYSDPEFLELMYYIDFLFKNSTIILAENFLECLKYLPINTKAKQIFAFNEKLKSYMHRQIAEHEQDFDPDNLRDYLDMFLKARQEVPESIALEEDNIFRSIVDLFMAGTETTGTSLSWLFVHLLNKPEVQDKCREEIHRVVGTGRMVGLADKESLPYMCATISEMQRICSIAPVAIPHQVEEPIEIGGYYLPKGTAVIFNLYSAHTDPEYWSRPLEFDPDRWLSADGKLIKHDAFWPFSAGPRMCLGRQLAQRELFLFFTNLLQRYNFTKPDEDPMPSTTGRQTGITLQPIEYRMCATRVV